MKNKAKLVLFVKAKTIGSLCILPFWTQTITLAHHNKHDNSTAHKYIDEVYKACTFGLSI